MLHLEHKNFKCKAVAAVKLQTFKILKQRHKSK